jgi:hypothetical protein
MTIAREVIRPDPGRNCGLKDCSTAAAAQAVDIPMKSPESPTKPARMVPPFFVRCLWA